jgi:hypothetical protein
MISSVIVLVYGSKTLTILHGLSPSQRVFVERLFFRQTLDFLVVRQ